MTNTVSIDLAGTWNGPSNPLLKSTANNGNPNVCIDRNTSTNVRVTQVLSASKVRKAEEWGTGPGLEDTADDIQGRVLK